MRKIGLFAVAAALIVPGVGAWVATTTKARVIAPIGARAAIDPLQTMMNARNCLLRTSSTIRSCSITELPTNFSAPLRGGPRSPGRPSRPSLASEGERSGSP